MEYAIFDTETDQYFTSNWPEKMCHKILKLWKNHHPEMNMNRFVLRSRDYDTVIDNSVILIINKATNRMACYFHYENKGYARGFNKNDFFFVRYFPPKHLDMTDIKDRFDNSIWDGEGEIIEI